MKSNILGTRDWIAPEDKELPKEDQTIFQISTLTFAQDTWLEDKQAQGEPEGSVIAHLLNMGLQSVDNFKDEDGTEIVFERDTTKKSPYPGGVKPWKDDCLSRIMKINRAFVAYEIRFGIKHAEAEAKN